MDLRRTPTRAEHEASMWLVRLNAPDATPDDRRQFEDWLERDPAHRTAYAAAHSTWELLGVLSPSTLPARNARRTSGSARRLAIAAGLAAVPIAAILYAGHEAGIERIVTPVGQHDLSSLPDGSSVTLNADTRLTVRFTADARRVRLQRGEALFDIRRDPARPFYVDTANGTIRVVGTTFLLRVSADGTRATVLSGVVEGAPATGAPAAPRRIVAKAGEEFILGKDTSATAISPQLSARRLAWRDGMLSLDGETLEEAAKEIERQTGVRFEFGDANLKQLRIGGYIKADDVDGFVKLLGENFDIRAERPAPDRVRLYR